MTSSAENRELKQTDAAAVNRQISVQIQSDGCQGPTEFTWLNRNLQVGRRVSLLKLPNIGLFHFLSVQGDGRKIPGLAKSMNFQRSTAKSPKIPWGWQHFATKFTEIEILILTDFSRQSCRCKQEFQGKKGKNIFQGARLENCTSTKSLWHSRTLVVRSLTVSSGFSEGKTCQGSFSRHYYSDDRKFYPLF